MTILICHGLPKSASSFTYQVSAKLISALSGKPESYHTLGFQNDIIDLTSTHHEYLSSNELFLIKSHGVGPEDTFDLLNDGLLKCVFTLRDPVDMALSYIEAGDRERNEGKTRFFHRFTEPKQTISPIKFAFSVIPLWNHPKTKFFCFDQLVENKRSYVRRLGEYLLGEQFNSALEEQIIAINDQEFLEFNVGRTGRGHTTFSTEEIEEMGSRLANEIIFYKRMRNISM